MSMKLAKVVIRAIVRNLELLSWTLLISGLLAWAGGFSFLVGMWQGLAAGIAEGVTEARTERARDTGGRQCTVGQDRQPRIVGAK